MHRESVDTLPTTPRGSFAAATRDAAAVWLGLFALGLGLGVLVTSHGLPWWLAPLISGTVYAGSVEFLLVGMLAAAAPISVIALTTFLVNSRHAFYGLSFPLHRVRGWAKAYSVYTLSDEAYALVSSHPSDALSSAQILWTQAGLHLSWVCGSIIGALAGATFLNNLIGLDFILTALFIVLAMDAYRRQPGRTTAIIALVAAVAAVLLTDTGMLLTDTGMLLIAMAAFSLVSMLRYTLRRGRAQTGEHHHA